jgi:predicted NAD/FAD-dependent oxidoreductase
MKITKKVDALVVGGGLIGLNLLKNLLNSGKNAILLEKSGELGGTVLSQNEESSLNLDALIWTQEENTNLFTYNTNFSETMTLGKKGLMPFVGFGDQKIPALDAIDFFANAETKIPTSFNKDIFQKIPQNKIQLHTQITSFVKASPEDETYSLFEINGKSFIEAKEVYWTAPVQELDYILPKDYMNAFKQKVKKAKHFDALTAKIELSKEELGEFQNNKFIFMGEESNPWMGCHTGGDFLTFVSYFESPLSSDHDFIRKHLKALKKQVNKAFPEAFDTEAEKGLSREKIILHKAAISNFNPAKKDDGLKELTNFKLVASHKAFWPHAFEGRLITTQAETAEEPQLDVEI